MKAKLARIGLQYSALLLLIAVIVGFGVGAPRFLELQNLSNILTQASSTVILATGMTFVLLVAGVDLSVGGVMYLGAGIAATLILNGASLWLALPLYLLVGACWGAFNAFFVARLGIMPFIVTLAMLFVGRGMGHLVTRTRAMNLPESFLEIGSARLLGVPLPIVIATLTVGAAHFVLHKTNLGRQIYAVGFSQEKARKSGIRPRRVLAFCYVISGLAAAASGIVSLSQLGAVAPNFGFEREFVAIAAAVMGGVSLFGGRGSVFPGTVLGALLLQTTQSGLVAINSDPYLYPIIYAGIVFFAISIDSAKVSLQGRRDYGIR